MLIYLPLHQWKTQAISSWSKLSTTQKQKFLQLFGFLWACNRKQQGYEKQSILESSKSHEAQLISYFGLRFELSQVIMTCRVNNNTPLHRLSAVQFFFHCYIMFDIVLTNINTRHGIRISNWQLRSNDFPELTIKCPVR